MTLQKMINMVYMALSLKYVKYKSTDVTKTVLTMSVMNLESVSRDVSTDIGDLPVIQYAL